MLMRFFNKKVIYCGVLWPKGFTLKFAFIKVVVFGCIHYIPSQAIAWVDMKSLPSKAQKIH